MKRWVSLLGVILLLAVAPVMAQADTGDHVDLVGAEIGVIAEPGVKPVIAYAITKDFSFARVPLLNGVLGPICQGWEASALYSKRAWDKAPETYVARLFYYKAATYKTGASSYLFAGIGVGTWAYINTAGADIARTAFKAGIGASFGPMIFRLAGDIVSVEGDNPTFLHCGVVFKP